VLERPEVCHNQPISKTSMPATIAKRESGDFVVAKNTISLRPIQGKIFKDRRRFRVVLAGRRGGKTLLGAVVAGTGAARKKGKYYYVAPTYRMARDIAWDIYKAIIPKPWIRKTNEQNLMIELINGSKIYLKGSEHPDSLRGPALDGVVMDECAFQTEYTWQSVLRPALSDRGGWGLFTTTPSPEGTAGWFYDLIMLLTNADMAHPGLLSLDPLEWSLYEYTSLQGGNIPLKELEYARATLPPETFEREYEAKISSNTGLVVSCFSMLNLDARVCDDPNLPLYVGIDFNNDPLTAICANIIKENGVPVELRVFNELTLKNATTWDLAEILADNYGTTGDGSPRKIIACPDPTGRRKQTSGVGLSDHQILRKAGITVFAPESHYNTADSIRAANAALRTADGEVHTKIHPRCQELIKSFRTLGYMEGTRMPNKKLGADHPFDAFKYLCMGKFNLTKGGFGNQTNHIIY
jgi:hypothetical protein